MKNIGIVGLGIMGKGMTTNFIKNGYNVFVWNRTKQTAENIDLSLSLLNATLNEYNKAIKDHKNEDWASINKLT